MKTKGRPAAILTLLLDAASRLVAVEVCGGAQRP